MRVLYLYCHPVPESFHGALRERALAGLAKAGHEIDLLDLHAEHFDPVMSAEARRAYHDTSRNQTGVERYVQRLRAANALVVQFPVWSFGPPAMLKGFLDRVLMPGVAFDLSDPTFVRPLLRNLKRVAGITTYGQPRWRALVVGDPPRKLVTRHLRYYAWPAPVDYYAVYHMNVATDAQRKAFMDKVEAAMARFGRGA